ncbi:MAG TPA: PKD domain-containing protein [Candidatus Omnitrophota bacterium]|nr:PKD domain-containing protein [Candidatus Omnitrophota bacterium]
MKKRKAPIHVLVLGIIFLFFPNLCEAQQNSLQPLTSSKCNEFTFDATGSYDQEGGALNYEWNFGDGMISSEPVVTHTYKNAGVYTVTLTIADDEGLSSRSSQKVQAGIAPTVNLVAPDKTCVNEAIRMDASASFADSRKKMTFSWDFGDGTTAQGKDIVTKTYSRGGNHKVRVTASDQSGLVCGSKTVEHVVKVNAPPVASGGTPEILKCGDAENALSVDFDANATYDVNEDALSYQWDFADGKELGKGEKLTYRFDDFGVYDVKLIVDDNAHMGCGTSVDFIRVQLNESPKAEAGEEVSACAGETIAFDGSGSYANPPGTNLGKWSFGDGMSANGLSVNHTYTKPGTYEASLTVESKLNAACAPSTDAKKVVVNSTPTVSFKNEEAVCTGTEVAFEADASDADGDELEYYWSFGDGMILRGGAKVTHIYEQGGSYQVSVIVDDKRGTACSSATVTKTIRVNTPPEADAGANQSCCVDVAATFDASASSDPDGDRLLHTWDFGDGNKANGAVVSYTYKKNGNFTVTLTVDDGSQTSCASASDSFTTQINTTPVPIINIR